MNKYIVPVYSDDECEVFIISFMATNLRDAEDKLMEKLSEQFNMDITDNLYDDLYNKGVIVGDIYDIEEF